MSVLVVAVLFLALVIGWFALAFVPALRELRAGVDARALPVAADGRVSPSYFADRFRRVLTERLSGPMQEVRVSGQALIGSIADEERFLVLPAQQRTVSADLDGSLDALVLAAGDIEIPEGTAMLREVYSEGRLSTGSDTVLRATLAEQGIALAARTVSLRWIHSSTHLGAGPGCRLYGRASAADDLTLALGCTFEKLHARRICFGTDARSLPLPEPRDRRVLAPEDLGERAEHGAGRTRVAGDLDVPSNVLFTGDLVVTGRLRIGSGVRIEGGVKARAIEVGDAVEIEGALVSSTHLRIAERARIRGPVLAEDDAEIGADTMIGAVDRPSTLRARRVDVHAGCVVHGAVWTLDGGGEVRA